MKLQYLKESLHFARLYSFIHRRVAAEPALPVNTDYEPVTMSTVCHNPSSLFQVKRSPGLRLHNLNYTVCNMSKVKSR